MLVLRGTQLSLSIIQRFVTPKSSFEYRFPFGCLGSALPYQNSNQSIEEYSSPTCPYRHMLSAQYEAILSSSHKIYSIYSSYVRITLTPYLQRFSRFSLSLISSGQASPPSSNIDVNHQILPLIFQNSFPTHGPVVNRIVIGQPYRF